MSELKSCVFQTHYTLAQLCLQTLDSHSHFKLESTHQCVIWSFISVFALTTRARRSTLSFSSFLTLIRSISNTYFALRLLTGCLLVSSTDEKWVFLPVCRCVVLCSNTLGGHWPTPSLEQHSGLFPSSSTLSRRRVPWQVPVLYVKAKECNDGNEKHGCLSAPLICTLLDPLIIPRWQGLAREHSRKTERR